MAQTFKQSCLLEQYISLAGIDLFLTYKLYSVLAVYIS